LVVVKRGPSGGRLVALNLYPVSDSGWDSSSDGARLMANALKYAATAQAAGPGKKVALVAADTGAFADDVSCKLQQTALFAQVDRFDGRLATVPALGAYDAVMTWSNAPYGASDALGNALADYSDLGRGVVEAVAAFSPAAGPRLDGRWRTGGYRHFS